MSHTISPPGFEAVAFGEPSVGVDPTLNTIAPSPVLARVVVPGLDRMPGPPLLDPTSGDPVLVTQPGHALATPVIAPPERVISVRINGDVPDFLLDTTWQRMMNDPGSGSITVPDDDSVAGCTYGQPMQFSLGGKVRHTAVVETIQRNLVASGEEADQTVVFSGRGLIAEWDDAVVYPDLGLVGPPKQDTRYFDWTNCDSSHWGNSVSTDPRYGERGGQLFAAPEGWPTHQSQWMWDRSTAFAAAPVGDVYFRENFGLTGPEAGHYQLWVAADDEYEVWVDGVPMSSRDGAYSGQSDHAELELDGGPGGTAVFHYVSIRATNRTGRGGVQVAIMKLDGFGGLDAPAIASTSGWRCLGYPAAPPGQTVGRAIQALYDEAQVRGVLRGWDLGFTDTHDSAGAPWPLTTDLTVPIGITMLEFLNQLAGSYIDYTTVPATRVLQCYNIDTMGVNRAPPDPLTELSTTGAR